MVSWVAVLGAVAAVCTTAAFIPQVVKTLRSGRADDFSRGYLALFTTGVTLWLVYGLLRKDAAVAGANAATLALVLVIVRVKLKASRRK